MMLVVRAKVPDFVAQGSRWMTGHMQEYLGIKISAEISSPKGLLGFGEGSFK